MLLTVDTFVLRQRFGDVTAFKMIREAGFDGVDYSFYRGFLMEPDYLARAAQVRDALRESGLSCGQAHAPFSLRYGEPLDLQTPHFAEIVRALEAAACIGIDRVVVHPICPPVGVFEYDCNLAFYRALLPYAERYGVCVAIENIFRIERDTGAFTGVFADPELLNRLLDELNSPYFCICVDVGHAAVTGNLPEDFLRGVKPCYLRALHMQDTDFHKDRHMLPYLERQNFDAILKVLAKIGYQDEMNLEIFKYLDAFPDALLPQALRLAAGVGRDMIAKMK